MLKLLRDKGIQKKIYMGLSVAVVFTFVVSGVLVSQDDPKTSSALAKFENHKISVHEYLDSYRAVQRQAGMMYGDQLDEMRGRINFKGEAWDRWLLLRHAKKQGLRVGDSEVVGWITKQEGFHKDGRFSDEFYRLYVERALRTTPRQFEEETRQMLLINKLREKVTSELDLGDEKLKEIYKEERAEKDLVYGLLPKDPFEPEVTVGDEEVRPLYEVMKKQPAPEGEQPKTEQEMMDDLKKQFKQSKTGDLAVKKLQEIKAKMKSPADFESTLQSEKITPEKVEKYKKGTFPAGIWPSENLHKAVEKLEKDGVSDVFETPKGAMIAKVTAVHAFDEKKFEEEKTAFREQVESQKVREKMDEILGGLRDKLSLNLELMKELFPAEN